MTESPLPTGLEVDRVATTMASAVGLIFTQTDKDTASQLRLMANAALIYHGTLMLQAGRERAAGMMEEAGRSQRAVIAVVAGHIEDDLLKALYRSASATEIVAAALDTGADDLPSDDETEF